MNILAVGDFHGKLPTKLKKAAQKADIILSTGDFGGSDTITKIIFKNFFVPWYLRVGEKRAHQLLMEDYRSGLRIIKDLEKLKKPVYTIFGNWDFGNSSKKEKKSGLNVPSYLSFIKNHKIIIPLKRSRYHIHSLRVHAFGGMVTTSIFCTDKRFSVKNRQKYNMHHTKEAKQLFSQAKKNVDILLCHYPPYGIFDRVKFKGNPMNGKHVGFKPYTDYIKRFQPKLFICGHMHEYQGVKKVGKTLVIATGAAKQGKAAMIEWPSRRVTFI